MELQKLDLQELHHHYEDIMELATRFNERGANLLYDVTERQWWVMDRSQRASELSVWRLSDIPQNEEEVQKVLDVLELKNGLGRMFHEREEG